MDKRQQVSKILHTIKGVSHVYFAPEVKKGMGYPCLRYEHSDRPSAYADNKRYIKHSSYTVMYITRDPDDAGPICDQLEDLMYSRYDRAYVADGLYHYVYTLTL